MFPLSADEFWPFTNPLDEPHFVRLPHDRVEAVEGEGLSAVDRCFGLVVAHTRRLIHHKSFFGDFCTNDRSDIYLESFLARFSLERDRQRVAAFVPFLRRDVGWVIRASKKRK